MDSAVEIVGNLTRDPELRMAGSTPVANFSVAVNNRKKNRSGEYEDVVSFFDVTCWQSLAENVAESLTKGTRVMVVGRIEQETWETTEGDKRSKVVIVADDVGPSLRWANASVTRNEKSNGNGQSRPAQTRQAAPTAPAAADYSNEESF